MTVPLSHEALDTDDVILHVDVCLSTPCPLSREVVQAKLHAAARGSHSWFRTPDARAALTEQDVELRDCVSSAVIDADPATLQSLHFFRAKAVFHVHTLRADDPEEDDSGAGGAPAFTEWELPNRRFHGVWETLLFDTPVQARLLAHAATSLRFARHGVDAHLVAWNKLALLHGPPGTGKTSLCQALAHKLTVRMGDTYKLGHLVEVNAHSLFSKYFSESGKLVAQLFAKIEEFLEERDEAVFVLLDEVESLTGARAAAAARNEPGDALRVVNALLTRLDALRRHANVMVLCTSNLPGAIDAAFVDRADITAYIGPPGARARYEILRSCVAELRRAGVLGGSDALPAAVHTLPAALLRGALPVAADAMHVTDSHGDATMTQCAPAGQPGDATILQDTKAKAPLIDAEGSSAADAERAVAHACGSLHNAAALWAAAQRCEGWSGRALRKLPFLAHSRAAPGGGVVSDCATFLGAILRTIEAEAADRAALATS